MMMANARAMRTSVLPGILMLRSADLENALRVLGYSLAHHCHKENRGKAREKELGMGGPHWPGQ